MTQPVCRPMKVAEVGSKLGGTGASVGSGVAALVSGDSPGGLFGASGAGAVAVTEPPEAAFWPVGLGLMFSTEVARGTTTTAAATAAATAAGTATCRYRRRRSPPL